MSDPYRVLELAPGATSAEVLDAYRRLSKLHHPDAGGSGERFMEIQRAYEAVRGQVSLEERLAALEQDVRASARPRSGRDGRADAVVRGVNDLVDGLDGLSSQLDG
ncbi:MAG TPA: DnaJ domain-containing protein [Solirubrobacter sp.]|nr:DnaJ domain-containing protein [Solirubrobacter sp.]